MGWIVAIGIVVVVFVVLDRVGHAARVKNATAQLRSSNPASRASSGSPSEHRAKQPKPPVAPKGSRFPLTWFGPGSELRIGSVTIASPCVYASRGEKGRSFYATDPSEIVLQAPLAKPTGPTDEIGYWPWYSRLDPAQRFEYLSWVSSGRTSLPSKEAHLFLYFYGIERRLLVDEADRAWGLQEIVRLRNLDRHRRGTKEGRSFRQYSTALLWFELAKTPDQFDRKAFDTVSTLTERMNKELIAAPLSWLAARGTPMPASLAQQVAMFDPASQRSVVTKRVPEEFNELFETRYREAYGEKGLVPVSSKRQAWHAYRPASGGLDEVRCRIANPLGLPSQFTKLPEIWNSCIEDLRKLSRVSASLPEGELTPEAWEAMPDELRADVDHPLAQRVTRVLVEATAPAAEDATGTPTQMVPAGRFAELVGIERRPKLTATQSRKVATTIEHTGYGLVPDARLSPVKYGWDELVAVVPGMDDDDVDSTRYNAAACVLRFGLAVALADGEADDIELRMLTDHIDAVFDLTAEEQERLAALRDLLLRTGSDFRPVARKVDEYLPPDARRKLGRLLVVIAAATEGIDTSERAVLRKAFKALELAPELLEETIAEILPDDDTLTTVKRATEAKTPGEPLPRQNGFRLNHEAISRIMSDTREVSVMLAEAMGAYDESESSDVRTDQTDTSDSEAVTLPQTPGSDVETAAVEASENTPSGKDAGPGGRYEPLYVEMITRDRWPREEAEGLARSLGLMLDAGVEVVNDWSFEALGAALIEDEGEELLVDRSLLAEDG